jgi:hypothetical protein
MPEEKSLWRRFPDVEWHEAGMLRAAAYTSVTLAIFLLGFELGGAIHGDEFDWVSITPPVLGALTVTVLYLDHEDD